MLILNIITNNALKMHICEKLSDALAGVLLFMAPVSKSF